MQSIVDSTLHKIRGPELVFTSYFHVGWILLVKNRVLRNRTLVMNCDRRHSEQPVTYEWGRIKYSICWCGVSCGTASQVYLHLVSLTLLAVLPAHPELLPRGIQAPRFASDVSLSHLLAYQSLSYLSENFLVLDNETTRCQTRIALLKITSKKAILNKEVLYCLRPYHVNLRSNSSWFAGRNAKIHQNPLYHK